MIERRAQLSLDEFQVRYRRASRPVILTNLVPDWPALRTWTPHYLKEKCGDAIVEVLANREQNPNYETSYDQHRSRMKFADYVDWVLANPHSNDMYLHAQNQFINNSEAGQRLLPDIPSFSYLDPARTIGNTFVWFGPAGTVTPLHHDGDDIMFIQVCGRKQWTVLSPRHRHLIYNHIGVFSAVDIENPDPVQHPLTRFVQCSRFILNPGEALFLPVNWWHHVRALDTSISMSHTNFWQIDPDMREIAA